MLNKKGNRLIKLKPYLCAIAVSFLGYGIFSLYLVSQNLKEINSFIVAFHLLYFKINAIQMIYTFRMPLEKFSPCPFVVIAAIIEEERKQRPTKIRKKVTADTNRGMLQVTVAFIPMWRLQGTVENWVHRLHNCTWLAFFFAHCFPVCCETEKLLPQICSQTPLISRTIQTEPTSFHLLCILGKVNGSSSETRFIGSTSADFRIFEHCKV